MIGRLPRALDVCGVSYAIDSDFRNILTINAAFCDDELTQREQLYICLKRLYRDFGAVPREHLDKAAGRAFWFISGGDAPKGKPSPRRLLDWEHDESMIFSAVNAVARCEVRELDYLHWWTFLGYLSERSENSLLSAVVSIRYKLAHGKKLEKYEREFLNNNRELVVLRTKEEQAAIDETEAFLKTLIG